MKKKFSFKGIIVLTTTAIICSILLYLVTNVLS